MFWVIYIDCHIYWYCRVVFFVIFCFIRHSSVRATGEMKKRNLIKSKQYAKIYGYQQQYFCWKPEKIHAWKNNTDPDIDTCCVLIHLLFHALLSNFPSLYAGCVWVFECDCMCVCVCSTTTWETVCVHLPFMPPVWL